MKSLFVLSKKVQAVVQKTPRKNITSFVLIFSSIVFCLMDVMSRKLIINLKELH